MNAPRPNIPDAVRQAQRRASDPESSAFVSANAGSGKTHVLVQRVIRLLLDGVKPEKILCVTFTKAAAANMAERIFTTLGQWVTLSDDDLDAAICATGIAHPTSRLRQRARELFACALETPGGLKVQTIHALCTRLLQQFPFEARVPAHFAVLDDRDQNEMLERASLAILLDAAAKPDSAAGRALQHAMTCAADVTFREVVREATLSRDRFVAWIEQAGSVEAAMAQVTASLGVAPDDTQDKVEDAFFDSPHLPRSEWESVAGVFDGGGKTDAEHAERLRRLPMLSGEERIKTYLDLFLTKDREPRKSLMTKPLATACPTLAQRLVDEQQRVIMLLGRRRALQLRDRTNSLLQIAANVAETYRREKQERGLLDYDDLIDRTLALLDRGSSGWVHYKLDRGVDHVLIDEAQDTSPRQWDIIAHLISEFTSGKNARDGVRRTIFAVGDEKQSIFSFQGAKPHEFDTRRRELKSRFEDAGLRFDPVSFTYSFRSGAAILQSVDQVFRHEDIYRSIHAVENGYPIHEALPDAGPALIDLWELEQPNEKQEIEGWRAAFDAVSQTSPEVRLARRVEAEIRALIAAGTVVGPRSRRRRMSYGDVLILVRRRSKLFDAVIQALKHAGLPVAGADRLKLTEHIAIIDLMNLADALLLPRDDLALAVALKSPLFGLDDDDLFELAWERRGTLRAALSEHAAGNARLVEAEQRLQACEARFAHDTPFAFYAWLLGSEGGRARILRRLGHEANDTLDEFLELTLAYESKAPASLQGFMAWLRAADTEIKRDMEISRDEIRVMTVHGAKGLEAPVVFLIDTTTSPSDTNRPKLIHLPAQGNAPPQTPGAVIWAGKKADDTETVAIARQAMEKETEDEYRRLLYVAMTRAADRLIIGGCKPGNRKELREACWYDLVAQGLERSDLHMTNEPPPDGGTKRYRRVGESEPDMVAAVPPPSPPPVVLPSWLRAAAPPDPDTIDPLRPSQAGAAASMVRGKAMAAAAARARHRGVLVHRLLQSLPDLAADKRRAAAEAYLGRNAAPEDGWDAASCAALADQILALLDDPRFAALFAEGSRAEVPIVGRQPWPVSGQVDRLVVTPDEVLIVDYKTSREPPRAAHEAPQSYLRQLALYRAVLGRLYPGRAVRAALLWTEVPEMMEIPVALLDAGLAGIMST